MKKIISVVAALGFVAVAQAETVPISGNVASKCSIYTDTVGVYGNPTPDELSTDPSDGGVFPIVRFDVTVANSYTAKIAWPNSFTTAPSLDDALDWDGSVSVYQVSDQNMTAYDTDKVTYDNVSEFDLTIAGSTWFKVESVSYTHLTLPTTPYV